jgi:hypothetical protein
MSSVFDSSSCNCIAVLTSSGRPHLEQKLLVGEFGSWQRMQVLIRKVRSSLFTSSSVLMPLSFNNALSIFRTADGRKAECEDEDGEDECDGGARDDGRRAARFLGGLGDGVQSDEGNDGEGGTIHKLVEREGLEGERPLTHQEFRVPRKHKAQADDGGFEEQIHRAEDFVEEGGFAYAAHVDPDEEHDQEHRLDEPDDFDVWKWAEGDGNLADVNPEDPGGEEVDVTGRSDGEECDVNRVIEQERCAGDKAPEIAQTAQCEILSTACNRIGGGEFGVCQADHDIDQAGEGEGSGSESLCGGDDESECGVDVGADIGVAPGVRTPDRYIAS